MTQWHGRSRHQRGVSEGWTRSNEWRTRASDKGAVPHDSSGQWRRSYHGPRAVCSQKWRRCHDPAISQTESETLVHVHGTCDLNCYARVDPMTRVAGTRGKPHTRQPSEVSTLLSRMHMALRWEDDAPARLAKFLPGWHPGHTPTSWKTGGLPTHGLTAAQRWADKLPYNGEQALVYTINLQPWELQHDSEWHIWPDGISPP